MRKWERDKKTANTGCDDKPASTVDNWGPGPRCGVAHPRGRELVFAHCWLKAAERGWCFPLHAHHAPGTVAAGSGCQESHRQRDTDGARRQDAGGRRQVQDGLAPVVAMRCVPIMDQALG